MPTRPQAQAQGRLDAPLGPSKAACRIAWPAPTSSDRGERRPCEGVRGGAHVDGVGWQSHFQGFCRFGAIRPAVCTAGFRAMFGGEPFRSPAAGQNSITFPAYRGLRKC
jgi:hypothetical protein